MNNEIENYEKLILELTDLDIQTNGRLNEVQRVQLELYKKIYLLLKLNNNLQKENKRLKQPKIFIDTQDMEERYGEELYKDYLEEQLKDYKSRIEKAVEYLKEVKEQDFIWTPIFEKELLNILNGRSDE